MRFLLWMQPRDHRSAARSASMLGAVAVGVTILLAPTASSVRALNPVGTTLLIVMIVAVGGFATVAHRLREDNVIAWALGPLLAVASIVGLDLLTGDATVGAQIFFVFPTLYGSGQLRRSGAIVLTSSAVLGEAVVVLTLLPLVEAVTAFAYVAAALVATSVLLVRSAERQANLVAILERQAAIDPLTGLMTRRVLDAAATSALSGAASVDGTSLLLLDVDDFKSINDRYGHPGGDEVLVQLAALLMERSRVDDVISRMGGDEIALLLPGCSATALRRRAEEIVREIARHTFTVNDSASVSVSVSIGLAHAPSQATDLRSLYVVADATLYEAKRAGRNRVGVSYPLVTPGLSDRSG